MLFMQWIPKNEGFVAEKTKQKKCLPLEWLLHGAKIAQIYASDELNYGVNQIHFIPTFPKFPEYLVNFLKVNYA